MERTGAFDGLDGADDPAGLLGGGAGGPAGVPDALGVLDAGT